MIFRASRRHSLAMSLAFGVATVLAGCGSGKESNTAAPATEPAATTAAPAAPPAAAPAPVTAAEVASQTWSPEALEDLLAPVALFPDPVLSQVLIASTNPQEVLDAGNWLIANEGLKGKALDDAAAQVGFTPPIRALVQFPQTIDMMCMEMGWTTELGQAFVADQAGVLAAVQRLRKQAIDVGNLKTSEAMVVETHQQEGQEVVVLKPPKPEVVYVPKYDPQAVYAPAPAAAAAPVTTTTTTTTEKTGTAPARWSPPVCSRSAPASSSMRSSMTTTTTTTAITTRTTAMAACRITRRIPTGRRMAVGTTRATATTGRRTTTAVSRTTATSTQHRRQSPRRRQHNYWDRYDNKPRPGGNDSGYNRARTTSSPITQAKPNRAELNELNKRQPRPMPADVKRPSSDATASNWKGQQSYAGKDKRPASAQSPQDRINCGHAWLFEACDRCAAVQCEEQDTAEGAGFLRRQGHAEPPFDAEQAETSQKPAATPSASRAKPAEAAEHAERRSRLWRGNAQRPTQAFSATRPMNRPSPGMNSPRQQGHRHVRRERQPRQRGAASQRGKQSMPQGAHSKGGGGKKKAR